jgi:GPH family glycoside/pentoside/hexuronide:cation symporter
MIVAQLSAIAVFLSTWWLYNPSKPWLQPLASGLIALTSSGFWIIDGSMAADVIDADELETGKRREGAFSACRSWILKLGMALGNLASGEILARTGFDATLGGNQAPHALWTIRFVLAAVPIAGLLISLFFLARFPLTQKRMGEIRQLLEARRGKV